MGSSSIVPALALVPSLGLSRSDGFLPSVGETGAWESSPHSTVVCPDHPRSLVQQPHTQPVDSGSGVGPGNLGRRPDVEKERKGNPHHCKSGGIFRDSPGEVIPVAARGDPATGKG